MPKPFKWNQDKNLTLIKTRQISFEQIVKAIEKGNLIASFTHPNKKQYPNQKILLIKHRQYIYAVPYVEDRKKIFLKTIFPHRKYTKKYLKEIKNEA